MRNNWILVGLLIQAGLFFSSCGPSLVYNRGKAVLENVPSPSFSAPDSVDARVRITTRQGRVNVIDTRIWIRPWESYKVDFGGGFGIVAASFLWDAGSWTLAVYEENAAWQGNGEEVHLPVLKVDSLPVHSLFRWVWGNYLNSGKVLDSQKGESQLVVMEKREGEMWNHVLDKKTGLIYQSTWVNGGYSFRYRNYFSHQNRPMPRKIEIHNQQGLLLEMLVVEVRDNPSWKRSPFTLPLPEGMRILFPG